MSVRPAAGGTQTPSDGGGHGFDPDAWLDQLRGRITPEEPERSPPSRGISGVLVPIVPLDPEPLVLYTRRSEHLSAHPGEVSFPGGGMEDDDAGPRETALRETREEVGVPAGAIDVVGHFTDFHTFHDLLISGYVGVIDPDAPLEDPTTPLEVAERLLVPLSALLEGQGAPAAGPGAEIHVGGRPLGTAYPVEGYEARQLPPEAGERGRLHYWRLGDDTTVWGITGELTARFLTAGFDWEAPADPRRVERRDELQP